MKIYNTLTRKKEEFIPIEKNKVKMYSCGPTVYSFIHIGNARPMIIFDTVRRYFEYKGMSVIYVQNYTDVDDKIINKAIEENVEAKIVSERYIMECLKDESSLNIKKHTYKPKVTEEMDYIINMINDLVKKKFAYEKYNTVYYNTKKMADYGKLSKKNIDELEVGSRVEADAEKENPTDFVLWKPAKKGEPHWPSPWGEGRPGWHIECSAMIKKYLGDTIDIHAGGEDLIFPHHENEMAQSQGVTGKPLANYWMHNGFINVDNQKMSKSKRNFFTIRDIAQKFNYDVIRFFIISGHYRMPINFSDELLQASENGLNRIKNGAENLKYIMDTAEGSDYNEEEKHLLATAYKFKNQFEQSMDDDFNTADAVTAIFELIKFSNIHVNENSSIKFCQLLLDELLTMTDVLGLDILQNKISEQNTQIEQLMEERQTARKNKDYAAADALRARLLDVGVILEDTPKGVKWSYKK